MKINARDNLGEILGRNRCAAKLHTTGKEVALEVMQCELDFDGANELKCHRLECSKGWIELWK
jgi:hypothetical protein